jgi:CheY-like chemotaxis protein
MEVAEQVLVAENGEQALRTLVQTCAAENTTCPSLILPDMNMPVLNGLAFLEAYTQLPLATSRPLSSSCSLPRCTPPIWRGLRNCPLRAFSISP